MGCVIRDICGIVSEIKYPCLRMSVFALLNARRQSTAFWDIHSKDRVLIPNYWKYPKESVLKMTSQEFMRNRDSLPDDIYVVDDTFEWSIAFTHEEDAQQKRFCLFTEGVCRIG